MIVPHLSVFQCWSINYPQAVSPLFLFIRHSRHGRNYLAGTFGGFHSTEPCDVCGNYSTLWPYIPSWPYYHVIWFETPLFIMLVLDIGGTAATIVPFIAGIGTGYFLKEKREVFLAIVPMVIPFFLLRFISPANTMVGIALGSIASTSLMIPPILASVEEQYV